MSERVYKVIEIVGTSDESWERAATHALETAMRTLRDIRIAEVVQMDVHMEEGTPVFRTKMKVSFKYHDE